MGDTEIPHDADPIVKAALESLRKRVEEHDGQLARLAHIVSDLEGALTVQAYLERDQSRRIKEHAQLIADHHDMLAKNRDMLASHQEFVKFHELKMREFDEKLNAVIEIIMRREGGPEAD